MTNWQLFGGRTLAASNCITSPSIQLDQSSRLLHQVVQFKSELSNVNSVSVYTFGGAVDCIASITASFGKQTIFAVGGGGGCSDGGVFASVRSITLHCARQQSQLVFGCVLFC